MFRNIAGIFRNVPKTVFRNTGLALNHVWPANLRTTNNNKQISSTALVPGRRSQRETTFSIEWSERPSLHHDC